jgi:hypothetical protein
MAKKDNKDSVPIEFYIPPTITGRGPRVPVPINQPNWIYKHTRNLNSKPDFSEWLSIGIILIIAIALGILLLIVPMNNSPLWIVVVAFGVFSIFLLRSAIIRTFNHKQEIDGNDENNISPNKRKNKLPKHRKDYK